MGDGKNRSNVLWKIILVLALIAGVFAVLLLREQRQEAARAEEQEQNDQKRATQVVELEEEIQQIKSTKPKRKGTAEVIFPDPDSEVYTEIYPKMSEQGYPGTLAISAGYLEVPGRLDGAQLQELTAAGWRVCYYWKQDTGWDAYDLWRGQIAAEGVETVPVIYYEAGVYENPDIETFQQNGVQTIIHHGEGGELMAEWDPSRSVWEIGAAGLQGGQNRLYLEEAVKSGKSIAYTVGGSQEEEHEDEQYQADIFDSMLSYFQDYGEDKLLVTTPDGAWTYQKDADQEEERWAEENQEQIDALEKEIEEIKNSRS